MTHRKRGLQVFLTNSPKRQRGDGFDGKAIPALTLGLSGRSQSSVIVGIARAGLGPHHLRQLVEVFIAGDECQLMLHGKTRNPEVVGRNRTSRKPQLQE